MLVVGRPSWGAADPSRGTDAVGGRAGAGDGCAAEAGVGPRGAGAYAGRGAALLEHFLHVDGPPPRLRCSHTLRHVGHRLMGIAGSEKKLSGMARGSVSRWGPVAFRAKISETPHRFLPGRFYF